MASTTATSAETVVIKPCLVEVYCSYVDWPDCWLMSSNCASSCGQVDMELNCVVCHHQLSHSDHQGHDSDDDVDMTGIK